MTRSRYRLGKPTEDLIEEQVAKQLGDGIIRRSQSPWCSPVVLVPKKDGSQRLCIDFKLLNEITERDAYPLPRIDDILDTLAGARVYSTLDATSGYYQIPVHTDDIPKTAFQTRSGLYEYVRMPFGLSNAPAAFQRAMDDIFAEERGKFLQVYLDDIIIYSKSREEHEQHLRVVLRRIKEAGLILKRKKCCFFKEELIILGYKVKCNEIRPTKDRIQCIHDFPIPTTIKELRSFLGLMSYCRSFINGLAAKAAPLTELLKGAPSLATKVEFSDVQLKIFLALKDLLNDTSRLRIPNFEEPFIVTTDASGMGISRILAQRAHNGIEEPVSFFSKKLTDAQT